MGDKERLDVVMLRRGLVPSRERAKEYIQQGFVYLNTETARKAGQLVDPCAIIQIRGPVYSFVGRGGLKLQKAVDTFCIQLTSCVCLDVGASTGGFTDCMLRAGASRVYAVDVGSEQLAPSLREDSRVVSLEKTDFRTVTNKQIPEQVRFASVDVSFISLKQILPKLAEFLAPSAMAVCLVKPQFEAGREAVGKHGIVKDPAAHIRVLSETIAAAQQEALFFAGLTFSPICGQKGNIEYLLLLSNTKPAQTQPDIAAVVQQAHRELRS